MKYLLLVFLCVCAIQARPKSKAVKPPYAANTYILDHPVYQKHAHGDPLPGKGQAGDDGFKYGEGKGKVLKTGMYLIQNLFGCAGEPSVSMPSGGSWHCHKYVGRADEYLALYGDRKETWEIIRVESMDGHTPNYIIRTADCRKKSSAENQCGYWYDDPDTDGDWLTLADFKETLWVIESRRNGWRIRAQHPCTDCKKSITWKGAGVEWKYLYAGDDEGVDFDFIPLHK